ncbi:CsbD family protein [Raineyella fluvialis]|uniref:CsbD family protein n=1 Tax=Raineyella fluvialis TaxID=2662261 RepID=UPI0018905D95|nr:CsbD family protein [Raineyella fluvialis]
MGVEEGRTAASEFTGKVKEKLGRITDNEQLETEGRAQQVDPNRERRDVPDDVDLTDDPRTGSYERSGTHEPEVEEDSPRGTAAEGAVPRPAAYEVDNPDRPEES